MKFLTVEKKSIKKLWGMTNVIFWLLQLKESKVLLLLLPEEDMSATSSETPGDAHLTLSSLEI